MVVNKSESERGSLASKQLTYDINGGQPVAEPPSRAAVEVNAVRRVIGPCQRRDIIVVAVVHQRITKDEVTRHLRS